jgi:outer membrane lipoprotein-sorting protein
MTRIMMGLAALALAACGGNDRSQADAGTTPAGQVPAVDAVRPAAPEDDAPLVAGDEPEAGPTGAGHTGGAAVVERPGQAPRQPTPQSPAPQPVDAGRSQDGDVEAILRRAASAYEDVRSLRADFVMNREIPALRQTITSRGRLYQQSPDRIALHFTEPDGDVILSDGRFFWVYYPSVNADQVIRSPAAAGGRSGVDLQAQFVGDPVARFDATLHGTESVGGREAHVLTLVPRQRAEYRSLKVWLDARDSLARRFEIVEHNGSMRRFDLAGMQTNVAMPAGVFEFTPPAGARIVDAG